MYLRGILAQQLTRGATVSTPDATSAAESMPPTTSVIAIAAVGGREPISLCDGPCAGSIALIGLT
ncbi:MAG: hypothetical protein QOE09_3459 [Ilumatobacteraceae bacterium]|jgi:hypothetical protein